MSHQVNYTVLIEGESFQRNLYFDTVVGLGTIEDLAKILAEIAVTTIDQTYEVISISIPSCSGCRYNQPNQQAHKDYGGCMCQDDE